MRGIKNDIDLMKPGSQGSGSRREINEGLGQGHMLQHGGVGSVGVLFFRLLLKNTEHRPQQSRIHNF